MIYRETEPHPLLQKAICSFWYLERDYRNGIGKEIIWPDGRLEILFHFGDRYHSLPSSSSLPAVW